MCSTLPKTRQQIAEEFGISIATFRRQLKKLDIVLPSGDVWPAFQKLIYESIAYPPDVNQKAYIKINLPQHSISDASFKSKR